MGGESYTLTYVLLTLPGLGALGIDFSSFTTADDTDRGVGVVAKHLLEHGVTSFCPTIVTSPLTYYKMVQDLR